MPSNVPDVIFARPRHEYQSYSDLWRLVQLAGYPLIYIDEIDPSNADVTYIYSTPDAEIEWPHRFPGAKARIIFWLLEWYGDYQKQAGIDEVWVSNRTFADHLNAKFVPMGSHPGLCQESDENHSQQYDVVHLSYVVPRREAVLKRIQQAGVTIAPNGWGADRHRSLMQSRAMLHIHQQSDYPAIAPLRAVIAAAYKLPLITEAGWSTEPVTDRIFAYPYGKLCQATRLLMAHDLTQFGENLYNLLCIEQSFKKCVEGVL